MHWIDALIVLIPLTIVLWLALRSRRYARGVVDYLAAGRVGGRYVIGVGNLASALSVITLVAGAEQQFETGFGVGWWNNIATARCAGGKAAAFPKGSSSNGATAARPSAS